MQRTAETRQVRWREVIDRLDGEDDLALEDLALLARAHWWLGDIPAATRTEERLHDLHLAAGHHVEAALVALHLGLMWGTRGDMGLGRAWMERGDRLLRGQPTCVAHGYAEYLGAALVLDVDGDSLAAVEAAERVGDLATRFADRTLECFALTLRGMAQISQGDLRGFGALEEALIPVFGGQVDPVWGGDVFCSVIHLCEALGDLARMRAWTDSLQRWAAPLSETFMYAGITRLHQLQLLSAEGQWDVVEAELGGRSEGLAQAHGWLAGAGFYELGEVHRLRGREEDARAAYGRARALGIEPQPGEALLQHAHGETALALDGLRIALAGATHLERARLIPATVEIALAAGDAALARQLMCELTDLAGRFGTPGILAGAAWARAACARAEGRWDEAEVALEEAARIHRQQHRRHDLARAHEALAEVNRARGETARADAAEATARAVYTALGARADLSRIASGARPGGLTAREVEVLARVSAGLTNKEVARDLVISDKTVGRHLSSIFTKTGVTSRTAAAAWARDHRLV